MGIVDIHWQENTAMWKICIFLRWNVLRNTEKCVTASSASQQPAQRFVCSHVVYPPVDSRKTLEYSPQYLRNGRNIAGCAQERFEDVLNSNTEKSRPSSGLFTFHDLMVIVNNSRRGARARYC